MHVIPKQNLTVSKVSVKVLTTPHKFYADNELLGKKWPMPYEACGY